MQPATVYLSVNPQAGTDAVRIVAEAYAPHRLRTFLDLQLEQVDTSGTYDNWIFAYEFANRDQLPPLAPGQDHSDYFKAIRALAQQSNRPAAAVVLLRDACFCHAYGLDPLSEKGSHRMVVAAPEYRQQGERIPICRAVELEQGVLLYDLNIFPGREAYGSLLQHCADHYFDPRLGIERLRLYDLHPFLDTDLLEQHLGALNFNVHHHSRELSLESLCRLPLLPKDILAEGMLIKEYDMQPTAACYTRYVVGEDIRLQAGTTNFDIAILDQIARHGYPTERLSVQWPLLCSYTNRFKDLAEQIVACEDPAHLELLQGHARERAQGFLERDFPDRRLPSRQHDMHSAYTEIPSRHNSQGPKI